MTLPFLTPAQAAMGIPPSAGCDCDQCVELRKLRAVVELLTRCLNASTGFVSAWEFDSHDVNVKPEQWWDELAAMVEEVGYRVFCQKCGAKLGFGDGSRYNYQGNTICSTCHGELERGGK